MKLIKRITIILLAIIMPVFAFSGCNNKNSEINKISKNLSSYKISAELDDDKKEIIASEEFEYYNNTGLDMYKLCFHLYANAFSEDTKTLPYSSISKARCFPNGENYGYINITNITSDGLELKHEIIGDDRQILEVILPVSVKPLERIKLKIDFCVKLSENTHRLGYFENEINLGNWYPILCAFNNGEFDLDSYYDVGDPFYSDIANYDVSFSFDKKYTVAATGSLVKESEKNNNKTVNYVAKAVRDFAMVLGSNYEILSEDFLGVKLNVYAYRGDESILYYMETAKKSFEFFINTFGIYPYETLNVVITNFLHGGMEYPQLAMVSDNLNSLKETNEVIVHEIAHQWWYSLVGNDEVEEPWLDEAMAEYSTLLFFEANPEYKITREQRITDAKQSYLLFVDVLETTRKNVNDRIDLALYNYSSEYEYTYMVYVKGMLMIDELRNKIGDEAFFNGIKLYFQNNKYKVAQKNNFIEAFELSCGQDLDDFFNEWLLGNISIYQN